MNDGSWLVVSARAPICEFDCARANFRIADRIFEEGTTMDRFYRRDLPHWRQEGACYSVTWRLHAKQQRLGAAERELVFRALVFFDLDRYELYAAVVMDDHVHVLFRPLTCEVETILRSWKGYSANRLQRLSRRRDSLWQREYFERSPRDDDDLVTVAKYIFENPNRRWPGLAEYRWRMLGVERAMEAAYESRFGPEHVEDR